MDQQTRKSIQQVLETFIYAQFNPDYVGEYILQFKHAEIKQATAELFEQHRLDFRQYRDAIPLEAYGISSKTHNMVSGYMSRMRHRGQ